MSKLEAAKERIAYLKFWLGIFSVTDVSLLAWLASNFGTASTQRLIACAVAAFAVTVALAVMHHRIDRSIEALRDL